MFKFYMYSLFGFLLLTGIIACNDSGPVTTQTLDFTNSIATNDAEFLLVAYSDPLEIEQEEAFIVDGAGPMYYWVLDLTDEQKEQIRMIVHDLRPGFKEMCARWLEGKSWEEIRQERNALREQIRLAIYEILTDEQKAIVDEIAAQLAAGEYPDAVVDKRVEMLTEKLGLSEEQQQTFRELFKEYGTLMIQARNASDDPREFHAAKFELFRELDAKIKATLNEEQLALYETLKSEMHRERFRHRFHHWIGRN